MTKNNRNIIVAVKGVIINEGKILLVQRASADAVGGGTWECAGGKIEFGEGLEAALVREIKEETGLTVTVDNLLYAASFLTDPARQVIIITYLCRSAEQVIRLSEEHTDYRWCTKDLLRGLLPPQIFAEFVKYHILELEELE
ncbi:NUDIX hydrolase [Paenibacillus tianjinensis]|uniref:NUDIX domain-containing protein n=1 Tax=Paenibacillus tianjinensis TaxID=2810347 RepID=A0ABX7LH42_9BACL|nr:NUDIX domain-containing protein [Paenibacillus tianjinensis]QSF46668.1 NUDIX domain-containing protein [Paenibacillus tianjinensis]